MGRAKGLNSNSLTDAEKEIIIKETAKRSSHGTIATILGRHIKTVQRFLKNLSPRNNCLIKGKSKF